MEGYACFVVVLIFSCVFGLTSGHMCLLSPVQRGSLNGINKPAADDCILLKEPCGGRAGQHSGIPAYKQQSNITVIFQKNLDHWDSATPGYFTIGFGVDDMASTFKEVARVMDNGEPNLTLYPVNVTLPALQGHPHQILQVVYVTKNAKAPAAFYQCSDFMLYG